MSSTDSLILRRLVKIIVEIPGMDQPDIRFSLLLPGFSQAERSIFQGRRSNDIFVDLTNVVQYANSLGKLDVLIDNAMDRPQSPETQNRLDAILNEINSRKHQNVSNYNSTSPVKTKDISADNRFDVFLAHNSQDKPQVEAVAEALKRHGLNPWLDDEQIRPGDPILDIIQRTVLTVKSAAIFIGPDGLGEWQVEELRTLVRLSLKHGLRVITILLPGVDSIPDDLPFLENRKWIRFKTRVDEVEAIDALVHGITGQRSQIR